jgi:phage gp36-like protein
MRYILEEDYEMQIKQEIVRLLTAQDFYNSPKLIRAEKTAGDQLRQYVGKRYDLQALYNLPERDEFIVTLLIDVALYHLYSQTGNKDIPKHRDDRYQDALDWMRGVGKGEIPADLPEIKDGSGETFSEVKIWSARPPQDHKY